MASRRSKNKSGIHSKLDQNQNKLSELLMGQEHETGNEKDKESTDALIDKIQKNINKKRAERGINNPLETTNALNIDDSLLDVKGRASPNSPNDLKKPIRDILSNVSESAVFSIFAQEQDRLSDYSTYRRIYEMITHAGEAVETYVDNIISPDDWSKQSIECYHEGDDLEALRDNDSLGKMFRVIQEKYDLDTLVGDSIKHSLYLGDYFTLVLNLNEELNTLLTEDEDGIDNTTLIESAHCPNDPDLIQNIINEFVDEDDKTEELKGNFRNVFTEYLSSFVEVNEDPKNLVKDTLKGIKKHYQSHDINISNVADKKEDDKEKADIGNIRGSIVRMIEPDYVIKLHSDGFCFGYFYIEYSENAQRMDFRKLGSVQNNLIAGMDSHISNLNNSTLGSKMDMKDRLLTTIFVKTLASKLKSTEFLAKNPSLSRDVYVILRKARNTNKKVRITYIPPSKMVHWAPEGSSLGYGRSVFMRVKFFSKLYIGALTKAFMRNSIWQTEMLAYWIEIGQDNDYENTLQEFIRETKQKLVQFEDMKDISTVMRNVGHFHNLFFPMINGERPVEIDTISLGQGGEVDTPFLEYLRKSIIAGTGVPAAFVGYSEEIAFARSLTMDNGRFLRRVIKHQTYCGRSATDLVRLLWENEFTDLKDREKNEIQDDENEDNKEKNVKEETNTDTDGKNVVKASSIVVKFPSPATLNISNLTEQMQQVDTYSDFIGRVMIGDTEDANYKRSFIESVVKDLLPSVPWSRYNKYLENAKDARKRPSIDNMDSEEGGS